MEKKTLIIFLVQLLIITIMEKVKKRRGRPIAVDIAGDRRSVAKNIRFSQKEWDVVNQKMMECEISEFSEYARLACLQLDPVIFDTESFTSLLYIKRDLKDFLAKIDRVDLDGKDLDNVKKCFSTLSVFLEKIFKPFSIKII